MGEDRARFMANQCAEGGSLRLKENMISDFWKVCISHHHRHATTVEYDVVVVIVVAIRKPRSGMNCGDAMPR